MKLLKFPDEARERPAHRPPGYWARRVRTLQSGDLIAALRVVDDEDYTLTHCVRVAVIGVAVARELRIGDTAEVYEAGLLHDIGKIAVPRDILMKPGKLTAEERALIELHAEEGERILAELGRHGAARHAMLHHERVDGSGYPHGIAEIIPAISQLVAAVDVFDALVNERPYRLALSPDQALRCVADQALRHDVVDALRRVVTPSLLGRARLIAALASVRQTEAGRADDSAPESVAAG